MSERRPALLVLARLFGFQVSSSLVFEDLVVHYQQKGRLGVESTFKGIINCNCADVQERKGGGGWGVCYAR